MKKACIYNIRNNIVYNIQIPVSDFGFDPILAGIFSSLSNIWKEARVSAGSNVLLDELLCLR